MPQSAAEPNTLIIQKQQVPTIFKVAVPTIFNAVSTTDYLQAK